MIRVILADDHVMIREGICAVLARSSSLIKVIGEFSRGREAIAAAKKKEADIYILDISMPILNGIEAAVKILKIDSKAKIIFLSMHDDRNLVERALAVGAKGYLLKESAAEEIIKAIEEVYLGRFFLTPKISGFVVKGFLDKNERKSFLRTDRLTSREREVLQLIAEGLSNKQIAKALTISLNTAHAHRKKIMAKLNVHKQAELIRIALKEKISQL